MTGEAEAVSEADKPFILAVMLVTSWLAGILVSLFYFKSTEMAEMVAQFLGPAAGMGYMFYLKSKE